MARWAHVALVTTFVVALALQATPGGAEVPASPRGLPQVASGRLPGPPILYAPPPASPILANHDLRFRADPILVSGAEAYVDGEYLYQDHLYDDYGADTNLFGDTSLQARYGDIDPPTDRARYGGNGADLVELRIVPSATEVTYRLTYNTLLAADAPIAVIAFDTDRSAATGSGTLVPDPGSTFPGTDEAITVWGTGGQHVRFAGAAPVTTPLAGVSADTASNQVTFSVPRSVSDPTGAWRMTWATGIHDVATHGWLRPGRTPSATQPGGTNGRSGVSGVMNVGPRPAEPYLTTSTPPDTAQAAGIRDDDLSPFRTDVSWSDLAATTRRSTVPTSGTQVRIFASRLDLGEGRALGSSVSGGGGPQYLGQLQPYSLAVPTAAADDRPDPFTLSLHSLGDHHWQYNGTTGTHQIGEQRGSFVATPMARGSGTWYQAEGEADVFEVWADVARHFLLDPDRVAISGYSMGGYGTYRLGGLYPDLFGRAYTTVGPPAEGVWLPPLPPSGGAETLSNRWLENNRNLPYFNLVASGDELVPIKGTTAQNVGDPTAGGATSFEALGYRYRFRVYDPAEHLTLALLSYDVEAAPAFLGSAQVDRDPVHVTYSHLPATDAPELGLVHDHAYWVSDVAVAAGRDKGTVDVFTHARGFGDPVSAAAAPTAGVDPIPFREQGRTWGEPPTITAANQLDVDLTGVRSTSLDLARAAIDTHAPITLAVDTDGPATLLLEGDFTAPTVEGAAAWRLTPRGLEVDVPAGESIVTIDDAGLDAVVPEAAWAALLPLCAIALGFFVLARRRRDDG